METVTFQSIVDEITSIKSAVAKKLTDNAVTGSLLEVPRYVIVVLIRSVML